MDGDIVDLSKIIELAAKYHAFLYLDEAHAVGILGKNGYGLSTTVDLRHIPNLLWGRLVKL